MRDAKHWNWGTGACDKHRGQTLPCQTCIDLGDYEDDGVSPSIEEIVDIKSPHWRQTASDPNAAPANNVGKLTQATAGLTDAQWKLFTTFYETHGDVGLDEERPDVVNFTERLIREGHTFSMNHVTRAELNELGKRFGKHNADLCDTKHVMQENGVGIKYRGDEIAGFAIPVENKCRVESNPFANLGDIVTLDLDAAEIRIAEMMTGIIMVRGPGTLVEAAARASMTLDQAHETMFRTELVRDIMKSQAMGYGYSIPGGLSKPEERALFGWLNSRPRVEIRLPNSDQVLDLLKRKKAQIERTHKVSYAPVQNPCNEVSLGEPKLGVKFKSQETTLDQAKFAWMMGTSSIIVEDSDAAAFDAWVALKTAAGYAPGYMDTNPNSDRVATWVNSTNALQRAKAAYILGTTLPRMWPEQANDLSYWIQRRVRGSNALGRRIAKMQESFGDLGKWAYKPSDDTLDEAKTTVTKLMHRWPDLLPWITAQAWPSDNKSKALLDSPLGLVYTQTRAGILIYDEYNGMHYRVEGDKVLPHCEAVPFADWSPVKQSKMAEIIRAKRWGPNPEGEIPL